MIIRTILTQLVLPPAFQFILAFIGLLLWWRNKKGLAMVCLVLSFVSLFLLSLPIVSAQLYKTLEIHPIVSLEEWDKYKGEEGLVIVILGGGKRSGAEYGEETVTINALGRLRYGALIGDITELPLLVTGGNLHDEGESEAEHMARILAQFGHEQVMMERLSLNTWENAKYTAELLKRQNIDKIILVTQAWHMRRSVYCFEQFDFEVIPAPTLSRSNAPDIDYVPFSESLYESSVAIREWLGLMVYHLFYEPPTQLESEDYQQAQQ